MVNALFENVIGQDTAKRKLNFYVDSYMQTKLIPNLLFVGPKGFGKTLVCRELAKGLVKFNEHGQIDINPDTSKPRKKTFIEVNASTIKNLKQFVNSLIIPYVQDKDCTVLIDEASELPKDVTMALLTILNPNPEHKNVFSFDEYVCDFDFKRQTFMFATSEVQKMFHALTDRLKRIDLEEYSYSDLQKIVQKGLKNVTFEDNVLVEIASVLRGNARAAQMMAEDIGTYLKNNTVFKGKDWEKLKHIMGILPLGLTSIELQVLRHLANTVIGTSLTCLSAKTGMSKEAMQKDVELYLQKRGLMAITTGGREITALGLNYLKQLDKKK